MHQNNKVNSIGLKPRPSERHLRLSALNQLDARLLVVQLLRVLIHAKVSVPFLARLIQLELLEV